MALKQTHVPVYFDNAMTVFNVRAPTWIMALKCCNNRNNIGGR